jgi:hypothetical protein
MPVVDQSSPVTDVQQAVLVAGEVEGAVTCKTCGGSRTVNYGESTCQPAHQGPCPSCVGVTIATLSVQPLTPKVTQTREVEGRFEARYCPDIPTDCCDYGVISHATGKEVCRVWLEEDARKIAAALTEPARKADRLGEAPDEDWLTDVIDDSLDMDWTGRVAARAIIAAWEKRHD